MSFRTIPRQEVKQILDISTCIELVEHVHGQHQMGKTEQPLRNAIVPKEAKGILATMPAYIGGDKEVMGLKVVTVFPGNHELGLESHQGAIVLMDPANGMLQAIIDAAEITALRTAAASAVATKYLARDDARILSLIGAGVQAHTHLKALSEVMNAEEIKIWNRTSEKAEDFVKTYSDEFPVVYTSNFSEALKADVICTLTAAKEPIFDVTDIKFGTHINAVGASQATSRELGSGFVYKASWFTDVYESAINEVGALLIPKAKGEIDELPEIVELGTLITNEHPGRKTSKEITIYKSLGVGIQDLICAHFVLSKAQNQNIGKEVDF